MKKAIELSVIVPVTEQRYDDVVTLYKEYKRAISATGKTYELVYVLDGDFPEVTIALLGLKNQGENLTVIQLAKAFGQTTALNVAFEHSEGNVILTLPAYQQIEVDGIPRLLESLKDYDVVIAQRWPRQDPLFNRAQAAVFNWLIRRMMNFQLHDVGCTVRAIKRQVIDEVTIYGDLHRFLPIVAHQRGFKIGEVAVTQARTDMFQRVYAPGKYVRLLLDLLSIFFLIRFTKKPLRFFGLIGIAIFSIGLAITLYIVGERVFADIALANRPALLLGSLFMILGIQVLAIGLLGELIIFTHAKEIKEYVIAQVIN